MGIGFNGSRRGRPSFAAGPDGGGTPGGRNVARHVALAALGLIAGAGMVGIGSLLVPDPRTDGQQATVVPNEAPARAERGDKPAGKRADEAGGERRPVVGDKGPATIARQDGPAAARELDPPPAVEPLDATGTLNGGAENGASLSQASEQAGDAKQTHTDAGARDDKADAKKQTPSRAAAALGDKPASAEQSRAIVAPAQRVAPAERTLRRPNRSKTGEASPVRSRQASRSFVPEEPPSRRRAERSADERALKRTKARAPLWRSPPRPMREARGGRIADRGPPARPQRPRAGEEVLIIDGPAAADVYEVIVPRYRRDR